MGPEGIPIPPHEENVITEPDPEIDKPDILVITIMRTVLKSKEHLQLDNS